MWCGLEFRDGGSHGVLLWLRYHLKLRQVARGTTFYEVRKDVREGRDDYSEDAVDE